MDETLALIVHACELAKKLDTNLPNLANHPNLLSKSCEEVVILFKTAIQRLNSSNTDPSASSHSPPLMIFQDPSASERQVASEAADAAVQEWLSSSYTQAMDLFLQSQFQSPSKDPLLVSHSTSAMGLKEIGSISQLIPGASSSDHHHMKKILELGSKEKGISFGGDTEGSSLSRSTGGGGGADVQMAEGADQSAHRSPVAHRSSRKRKDGVDKRTVRVAAPKIGNTEIPPDDGFTWRKYGQKEILGSMFPRGYFRCTHKNFYGCEAKKQVQRLDENPNIFAVTYYGQHTCHLSSSAPSAFPAEPPSNVSLLDQPPPPLLPSSTTTTTTTTTTTNIAPSWPTSIEMEATSTGESSKSHVFPADDLQLPIYYYKDFIGTRSSGGGGGSGGAGPSSQPGRDTNKEGDCPVLDLADVMFNSGSSSNSMDSIFPSVPDNK